jgi:hypothetical protein
MERLVFYISAFSLQPYTFHAAWGKTHPAGSGWTRIVNDGQRGLEAFGVAARPLCRFHTR